MLFLSFLLGFSAAFIGFITPSMLNITAAKISLEKNKKVAIHFSFGASLIVFFQSLFGLFILKVINTNSLVLEYIQTISITAFFILSFVFFRKAILERKEDYTKKIMTNGLLTGLGLSFVNMFAVPYFGGVSAFFNLNGWLELNTLSIVLFSFGASLGLLALLNCYILLAERIKSRITRFTKYSNFILGVITGLVAVICLIKLL